MASSFGLIGSGLVGSAVLGGLQAMSAKTTSRSLKDAAEEDYKRLGDYITQSRVDRVLQTERLAREGQIAVGNMLNASPEGMSTLETIASRVVAGIASDQWAIDEELKRRETAAMAEMRGVETRTNNQLATVASSVGQAIGEGFQTGTSMYLAATSLSREKALAEQQSKVMAGQEAATASNQAILDERLTQEQMRTRYEIGEYKKLMAGNEALANSAGTRVGLAMIFNKRYGGPNDPFYTWGTGGPSP